MQPGYQSRQPSAALSLSACPSLRVNRVVFSMITIAWLEPGIGCMTAENLAAAGYIVYAGTRNDGPKYGKAIVAPLCVDKGSRQKRGIIPLLA